MSVAAPSPTETKAVSSPVSLWTTGLLGAVYVLATLAVVFYGVPQLWKIGVSSWLEPATNSFVNGTFRGIAQLAAGVLLIIFGLNLAGPNPPRGMRGSVFLGLVTLFVGFFLIRAALSLFERMANTRFELGYVLSFLLIGFGLYLFYKFLKSDRFPRWSVALQNAGWFDATFYKKNQGLRVRRLTILGILILFGSGVYTLLHNQIIAAKDWTVSLPFTKQSIILLPDAQFTVPLLLAGFAIWFAWRVVNYPVFADFLIATEAEINKVSWTPRPRLIQDTIVVLTTLVIITVFLFVVDIFWGWILSREIVGVLPSDAETKPNIEKQINTNEY